MGMYRNHLAKNDNNMKNKVDGYRGGYVKSGFTMGKFDDFVPESLIDLMKNSHMGLLINMNKLPDNLKNMIQSQINTQIDREIKEQKEREIKGN